MASAPRSSPPPMHAAQRSITIKCFPCPNISHKAFFRTAEGVALHVQNTPQCNLACDALLHTYHNVFNEEPFGSVRVGSLVQYYCTTCRVVYRYTGWIIHLLLDHTPAFFPRQYQIPYFSQYLIEDRFNLTGVYETNFVLTNDPVPAPASPSRSRTPPARTT